MELKETYTAAELIRQVEDFCRGFPTYAAAAKRLKCTPSQLSQTRAGRLDPIPSSILKGIGYKLETVYTLIKKRKAPVVDPAVEAAAIKAHVAAITGTERVIAPEPERRRAHYREPTPEEQFDDVDGHIDDPERPNEFDDVGVTISMRDE